MQFERYGKKSQHLKIEKRRNYFFNHLLTQIKTQIRVTGSGRNLAWIFHI